MTDFKIRGKCGSCKKIKWFISKRTVKIPTGATATSQDLFCGECYKNVKKALKI